MHVVRDNTAKRKAWEGQHDERRQTGVANHIWKEMQVSRDGRFIKSADSGSKWIEGCFLSTSTAYMCFPFSDTEYYDLEQDTV